MNVNTPSPRTNPWITVLGVWAHPDDEAFLSAALMHRVARAGGRVVVVTATLGEAGLPSMPPEHARALRRAELAAALAEVGVHEQRILEYPDGGCADVDEAEGAARIEAVIHEVRPDVIVTFGPDGITGHPDHQAVSRWATEAWRRTRQGRLLFATMTDRFLIEHARTHELVGLSLGPALRSVPESDVALRVHPRGEERARKRRALDAHRSQTAPLVDLLGYERFHGWFVDECFRSPTSAELVPTPAHAAHGVPS